MSRTLSFIGKQIIQEFQNIFLQNEPIFNLVQFRITLGLSGIITGWHAAYTYGTTKQIKICIKDKYTFTRNGFTEFMVIDNNGKHYNVNNSLWYWKWDSIEDWHNLESNKDINIKYYGLRIPLFGIFPNIVMSEQSKFLKQEKNPNFTLYHS